MKRYKLEYENGLVTFIYSAKKLQDIVIPNSEGLRSIACIGSL